MTFQPGKSGNPAGRPRSDILTVVTESCREKLLEAIDKHIFRSTINDLKALSHDNRIDPSLPVLDAIIVGAAIAAIKKGDFSKLDIILNRVIGKPKEFLEQKSEHNVTLRSPEEVKQAVLEMREQLEKQNVEAG